MNIVHDYVTGLVQTYVAEYLDNFDINQLNFSMWKGALELNRLQLNSKILDNSPLPLKLKYGRIGKVRVEIPSILKISSGKIDIRVSDVFVCLE
jgi:N-terminal region of Chorein or VPS13